MLEFRFFLPFSQNWPKRRKNQ